MNRILRILMIATAMSAVSATSFAEPAENNESVANVAVSKPIIRVIGSHVEITLQGNESRVVVCYSLTGQIVKTLTIHPGTTQIDLPTGYYIIRCERYSQRVICVKKALSQRACYAS